MLLENYVMNTQKGSVRNMKETRYNVMITDFQTGRLEIVKHLIEKEEVQLIMIMIDEGKFIYKGIKYDYDEVMIKKEVLWKTVNKPKRTIEELESFIKEKRKQLDNDL